MFNSVLENMKNVRMHNKFCQWFRKPQKVIIPDNQVGNHVVTQV